MYVHLCLVINQISILFFKFTGRQTFKCGYANCDWQYLTQARLEKHIENCHGPNAKKRKMKNGKPKTYPIPQYKGEPGKIPCPHCNRPLADEKQLESHIKRFIVNIILVIFFLIITLKNHLFLHLKLKFI